MRRRSILLAMACLIAAPRPAPACTVFLCARGGVVLAGNNEDWADHDTRIAFHPADDRSFGRVYFGFADGYPQGGLNDRGLFFDGLALEGTAEARPGREPFAGLLTDEAMRRCSTVAEVVELFERYDFPALARAQLLFGDAKGDAAILERGAIVRKRGGHQVATNFRQSVTPPADARCPRHAKASALLEACGEPTVAAMRGVLDAVDQEITVYSNVYDLVARDVYVYLERDFAGGVRFQLEAELKKGRRTLELASFVRELQRAQQQGR